MQLPFYKYEGLGNDFVIVDVPGAGVPPSPEQAIALCDRHLGVGADGVLIVDVRGPRASMRVINADGSVPEMCGNGIRCVALHLSRGGHGEELVIDTDAGPHRCRVVGGGRAAAAIEVAMRPRSLEPAQVPVLADAPLVDAEFSVAGRSLRVTALSLGNPHLVSFDEVGETRLALGPALQHDPRFPQGINVGFAKLVGPGSIELAVFERGAGWTRACGTGACAAAIAAVETGRAPRGSAVEVRLPGGALTVTVGQPADPVLMTGPARFVFSGTAELD